MTSSREGGERLSHKGAAVTESGRVQQQGTEMDGLSDSSRQKPNTLGETQGWITGCISQAAVTKYHLLGGINSAYVS